MRGSVWRFDGQIPASKSILNRLLVLRSFAPALQIEGDSDCEDVVGLKKGLENGLRNQSADCGSGGTTLRFLVARLSRELGEFRITGSERLLSRPHQELFEGLGALGVEVKKVDARTLVVRSQGWHAPGKPLVIDTARSSQFASALLLAAINLPFALQIQLVGPSVSAGYLDMTLRQLTDAGVDIHLQAGGDGVVESVTVPSRSQVRAKTLKAEMDMSSAFAVAGIAVFKGEARLHPVLADSVQPDSVFLSILGRMGVAIKSEGESVLVSRCEHLQPIKQDLGACPDLFPVLSVLCGMAYGTSELLGASHLAYKESDRLETSARLLKAMNRRFERTAEGLIIHGDRRHSWDHAPLDFDPDQDHRMAMAAAVARAAGVPLRILHSQVVGKSFPGFWHAVADAIGEPSTPLMRAD